MNLPHEAPVAHRGPGGSAGPRVRTRTVALLAAVGLLAGLGVTVWLVAVQTESPPPPACTGPLCAIPPTAPAPPDCPHDDCSPRANTQSVRSPSPRTGAAGSPDETRTGPGVWTSSDFGFSFEIYDFLTPTQQDGHSVTYDLDQGSLAAELHIEAVPADQKTPDALIADWLDDTDNPVPHAQPDTNADTTLDGPSIGFVPGVGGSYRGNVALSTGGVGPPAVVAIFAATNGRITVLCSYAVVGFRNAKDVLRARGWADGVLSSFEWPT